MPCRFLVSGSAEERRGAEAGVPSETVRGTAGTRRGRTAAVYGRSSALDNLERNTARRAASPAPTPMTLR